MKHFLVLLFVFCAVSAVAQVPSGTFNYAFTNTPLWDASGIYTNNSDTNGVMSTIIVQIQESATGQITGTRSEHDVDGENSADIDESLSGKFSVKAGVPIASLKSSGTVTGVENAVSFTGHVTGKSTKTIDADTLTLTTSGTEKVCVTGGKCVTEFGTDVSPLLTGMNGDWTLDTDITAAGDKLTGTGTLTLSNARAFSYQITGSYSTKTQIAKLKLVGTGDAAGTSLAVSTFGSAMELTVLKGKVLGEKPTFVAAP
jgi:hypothetical protein